MTLTARQHRRGSDVKKGAFDPAGLDLNRPGAAFAVSRRGTYAIGEALAAAGLARREMVKGKVLLVAEEPQIVSPAASLDQAPSLPAPALA